MKNSLYLLAMISACFTGCSSRNIVHERGWIGGTFANVRPASKFMASDEKDILLGMPAEVSNQYKRAVFIAEAEPASPLETAGLTKGDLVLELDGKPVDSVKKFHEAIDQSKPGSTVLLKIFRNGEIKEQSLAVGREKYRVEGTVMAALGFKTNYDIDLFPNPNFSLIALGFKQNDERLNLSDPRVEYLQKLNPQPSGIQTDSPGRKSTEGWRAWLVFFELAKHKRIISQEAAEPAVAMK